MIMHFYSNKFSFVTRFFESQANKCLCTWKCLNTVFTNSSTLLVKSKLTDCLQSRGYTLENTILIIF